MTTHSTRSQTPADSARPTIPRGHSARAAAGRHSAAPGAELAAELRRGTGYDKCYDRFAPQLYRYCWALLGPGGSGAEPDRAAAAVRETCLAAAHSIGALRDDRELDAWLYALARTAARRRGFAPRSAYAGLPTAAAERAALQLSLRLPPSQRELLELYLRHGLPTARIARVLGLGDETAAELCRAAVLRAAELLTRHSLAPDRTARHGPDRGVRAVLVDLEPPGPPLALRERVVEECAAARTAEERRAAAQALAPLGEDGFPLHRNRALAAGADESAAEPAPESGAGGSGVAGEPALLPGDRVTTRDVPAQAEPEPVAEPGGAAEQNTRRPRRRWLTPVTAVLAAAAVVGSLWGAVAAVRAQSGDTVTGSHAPAPPAAPSSEATGSGNGPEDNETPGSQLLRPQPLDDTTVARPSAPQPGDTPPPGQEDPAAPTAPGADRPSSSAAAPDAQGQGQGEGQEEGAGGSGGAGGSAEGAGSAGGGSQGDGSGSGSGGSGSDGSSKPRGPVTGLIGGLLDLLGSGD